MADMNKETDETMSIAPTPAKAIDNKEEGQSSDGIEKNDIGSGQGAMPDNLDILLSAAEMTADAHDIPNMETEERLAYLRRLNAAVCQANFDQKASGSSSPFKGQEEGPSLTEMSGFEAVWRTCSNNQSLSILEANRTHVQAQKFLTDPNSLTEKEKTEMAVGVFKLSADPAWNFKDYAESVNTIFCLARKAAADDSCADQQDIQYMSALSMAWTDDCTASAFNASMLYHRYKGALSILTVHDAVLYLTPYLTCLLRLKIIVEKRDGEDLPAEEESISSRKTKPAPAQIRKQGKAKGEGSRASKTDDGKKKSKRKAAPTGRGNRADSKNEKTESEPSKKAKPGAPQSHPQHVIDSTVDWLRSTKEIDTNLQRFYKLVPAMWTSGEFEWTKGQTIPTASQIYYWVRNSRRERPPLEPIAKMSSKRQPERLKQALKNLVTVFKARQLDYRGFTSAQMALSKSFERITQLLHQNHDCKSLLMLAQVSSSLNARLVRTEIYSALRRIAQGRNIDIDAQLVLKQWEYSELRPSASPIPAKLPSSTQLLVDFSALCESAQVHALNRFKGDFRDTIVNLGDVLNMERLIYVGEGGFGSVFALPGRRIVMKVFKRPVTLQQAVKDVSNEAASFHLGLTLSKIASGGGASRSKALPFAPLPAVEVCGSTSGAMALPSWAMGSSHGLYYPALVMEMAVSTIDKESRDLSKSFFSDPMGAVRAEGFARLASFVRLIAEPLAAMHSLNSAHRDLKEENILAMRIAAGVQGYIHFDMTGKKITGRLGDCGKALYFGVEFHPEHEPVASKTAAAASRRAKAAAAAASFAVAGPLIDQSISNDVEMRPPADMMGKAGTVPLVIPMSAVHQHVPVAPSTQRTKDEAAAAKCRAPQYSGTLPYTPPEVAPKLADGARFLTARDYQPGDMWALGIVLANVLGGSGIRQAHLASHDKKIFAQAEDRVIWCKLNKLPAALQKQCVPSEWTDVMDLLRSLTREEPSERMTAKEVLDHPFLKQADKMQGLYS